MLKRYTKAKICAVVKADAYGHGMGVIPALTEADEFAVSSAGEAAKLREYTDKAINILSAPDKTAEVSYAENVFPAVCS